MPFAAALSEHPVTASAIGEVAGQVLEQLGTGPDLALLFVTAPHAGALEDAAAAVQAVLAPNVLVGCAAVAVAGARREVEHGPGVTLWAAAGIGPVAPVELWLEDTPDGPALLGWPAPLPFDPAALLLVGDPFSFPAEPFFARMQAEHPGMPVIGGMASAARGPGGNRLALGTKIVTRGAVGALVGPGVAVRPVVSQGCRPVGDPYVVTRAERNIVYELAGRPALERLLTMAKDRLTEDELRLVNSGLHLGVVIDEHRAEFDRGDFLVRNVLGADRGNGAIAVGDAVDVGTTVQYHVRDARTADEDLRHLLAGAGGDAALLFTCNGRGTNLFGEPDHDASVLADALDDKPVAGFFAAGEFGPVGGRNFVHGFTASIALFEERGRAQ